MTSAWQSAKKLPNTPQLIYVDKLQCFPYASILCYPTVSVDELRRRVSELHALGVEAIELYGRANVSNIHVLGKGYVGIVVAARLCNGRAALKIRRVDADRVELLQEARMLAKANEVNVGPRLINASKNFLLMQLIEGEPLPVWLDSVTEPSSVRCVVNKVLEQCWQLDEAGLDHGELSNASKHILVDSAEAAWIVDFESASLCRKVSNVTSICQFLFLSRGHVATSLVERLGMHDAENLLCALRAYKQSRTRVNFESILRACIG